MEGKIKFFNEAKGYGFITADDGTDYFFHFSAIDKEGYKSAYQDQRVSFDEGENDKGKCATNVKIKEE